MPTNTKVHKMAKAIMREHPEMGEGSAIAIAQSKTHQSYATGRMLDQKTTPHNRTSEAREILRKHRS